MLIVKGTKQDLEECVDIIFNTEMGQKYYPTKKILLKEVEKGQNTDEFYVAKNDKGEILGILWYQYVGMFHAFPYLHIIAVKRIYQNYGIGSELLDFFEEDVLINGNNHIKTKIFLAVGDFNIKAEKLYLNRGYEKICEVKGLFRKDVTERILMKTITSKIHKT